MASSRARLSVAENRILVGLPERLNKAKKSITRLEKREQMIRSILSNRSSNPKVDLDDIEAVLDGWGSEFA
jgi:hypothetical protein